MRSSWKSQLELNFGKQEKDKGKQRQQNITDIILVWYNNLLGKDKTKSALANKNNKKKIQNQTKSSQNKWTKPGSKPHYTEHKCLLVAKFAKGGQLKKTVKW